MQEVLDRLHNASEERKYLLEVLKLWDIVAKAGYTAEQVTSFTFREQFLSSKELRLFPGRPGQAKYAEASKYWHNCVRLHSGELKPIPLTRRPDVHKDERDTVR